MSGFSEADLDLEKLFLPAWAQEKPEKNRFEHFTGEEKKSVPREKRRGRFSGFQGDAARRSGPRRDAEAGRREQGRRDQAHRDPPAPLPEITAAFVADEKGVEHLARQIKATGRAYPLFQIAHLVLQKPERYAVRLGVKKKADGGAVQSLYTCALDETPWLSEDEAVAHVLKNHFGTFYQVERTATDPPKGTYTFVAQCGISGMVLGPPNYHDYQNQLRRLHAERFSRMPFDAFKARVKIVKDEAVVKKWIEERSFKSEYICLNVPEPLKLASLEEVEKHFRATHKEAIIKTVETTTVDGPRSRNLRCHELQRLVRVEWERQRHFPLQMATSLSKQLGAHGLQFFKVNKTAVHVSVARPQFLDLETTPVSENIRRIVDFINSHTGCSRKKLMEALAPARPSVAASTASESPAPETPAQPVEPAPEQTALIADLHWLIHQGHILEFADGRLETAKKPAPRPPKPVPKTGEAKAAESISDSPAKSPDEPILTQTTPPEAISPAEPCLDATPAEKSNTAAADETARANVDEQAGDPPRSSIGETPSAS